MLSVSYAECHLCCVTNKPFMLSVFVLNVVMLSVIMLNVVVLNVVAPLFSPLSYKNIAIVNDDHK
jgi:hypothetical protein